MQRWLIAEENAKWKKEQKRDRSKKSKSRMSRNASVELKYKLIEKLE